MSRTIDDLRATLQSHGRDLPISDGRTQAVHRRVARVRRRRLAGSVASVVALAAVAALGVSLAHRADGAAAHRPAAYFQGGRLAASVQIDSRYAVSSSVDVVATSTTLILEIGSCGPTGSDIGVVASVNGAESVAGCGASGTQAVKMGERLHIEYRLAHLPALKPQTFPTAGLGATYLTLAEAQRLPRITSSGGVYFGVPRSEYVFPPKPATLVPLGSNPLFKGVTVSSSGGTGSRVSTVDISQGFAAQVDTVAPGVLSLELDGKPVGQFSSWDYMSRIAELGDLSRTALAHLGITADTAQLTVTYSGFPATGLTWQVQADNAASLPAEEVVPQPTLK